MRHCKCSELKIRKCVYLSHFNTFFMKLFIVTDNDKRFPPLGTYFQNKPLIGFPNYFLNKLLLGSMLGRFKISSFYIPICCKVNSVQEAWAKYFAVHISKFEILQTTWKNKTKNQNARSIGEKLKNKILMFFVSFFSCDLQDFKF